MCDRFKNSRGSAMMAFLMTFAVASILIATALKFSSSSARTIHATKQRSERYYLSESGLNLATSWIRQNSQYLVSAMKQDTFYTYFERSAIGVGSNDVGPYPVPTKIKIKGTTDSAILTNDSALATSAFPNLTHIVTGASFSTVSQFASANFNAASVRITLVDVIALDPTKDAPPLASPQTDFYPVYRIDSMTDLDKGTHVYGYITGNLYYVDTIGFYGKDYVNVNQSCTSAAFTNNNAGPTNSKCPVGSMGNIEVANNAKIFGSGRSNSSVNPNDKVCGIYPGCTSPGNVCEGSSCNVPDLPTFNSWEAYCPTNLGVYTVSSNTSKSLNTTGCYSTVTIQNKGKLTLTKTSAPYFFDTLDIQGGTASTNLIISPDNANLPVQLYVRNIAGDVLNGNQNLNPTARPSQFKLFYLGAADIKLNGNANMSMAVVAPYANVTIQGNADFRGGVIAKSLDLTGSANIIYDESLGGTSLNDLTLRLRQEVHRYR